MPTRQSRNQLFAMCTELFFDRESVLLLAIVLLAFTKSTHGNIAPRCHDHVEVCIPPDNNEAATFSCCSGRNLSECTWVREGNLSGNLGQETETGLKLTLQSLPDNYGQYNCLYRANGSVLIQKQLLFVPRDMYENCPFCMSLEVCTTNTEVLLVLKTLFNTSLLHAHMCDTDATESLTITLNTPTALQTERMGYSFDCSICEDGRHNIHYYIARSTFTNVSSCVNYSTSSKSTITSTTISSVHVDQSSSVNTDHSTSFMPMISSPSTSPSVDVSSVPSAASIKMSISSQVHSSQVILSTKITMISAVIVTPSLGPTLTPSPSGNSDGDRTTEVAIGVSVGLLLITGGVLVITIICCLYRNICRNKHNSKPEGLMSIIYKLQVEIEKCLDVDELMAYLNNILKPEL
ncbi:uncharacterized protein [Dysidea avara]|uniref:uncharacterized protein isoform X2 n=1 Tax=Dysidea avara TaxID=196820 RepID=UPI00331BF239